MDTIKDVGIVLFNGVERLDFEGPMGVLGWTRIFTGHPITIRLLSKDGQPVCDHLVKRSIDVDGATTEECKYDLILVPGGDPAKFVDDQGLVDEICRLGVPRRCSPASAPARCSSPRPVWPTVRR